MSQLRPLANIALRLQRLRPFHWTVVVAVELKLLFTWCRRHLFRRTQDVPWPSYRRSQWRLLFGTHNL